MEKNIKERLMIKRFVALAISAFSAEYTVSSQNLSVLSIKIDQTDSTYLVSPRYDINGNDCALVKVIANNINGSLEFKGNIIGEVKAKDSTYIIYVTDKTKRLKIYHPEYIPETIDFTQYEDAKKGVEGKCVYLINISGNISPKPVKKAYKPGSRILSFSSEAPIRQLFVNGIEWEIVENTSKRLMPYGDYEYDAITDGNVHKKGKVELKPSIGSMIVRIEFK